MFKCIECEKETKQFLILCEDCFARQEYWCQICGKIIDYAQYTEARGFYCKDCNKILTEHVNKY